MAQYTITEEINSDSARISDQVLELAILANESYRDGGVLPGYHSINGWEIIANSIEFASGYSSSVYKKGDQIVIAHRGSELDTYEDIKNQH